MEQNLQKLKKHFPSLPQNDLLKIYKARLERVKVLTRLGMPEEVRWFIEAKVRLSGEFAKPITAHLPGTGRSTFAKKRRAKRMQGCYKCARWNCDTRCQSLGYLSINREDKIRFIKDGLSKESLDNIRETLDAHPSGFVQRELLRLRDIFQNEQQRYSLGNLTLKDPVCQSIRKLDGKLILNS